MNSCLKTFTSDTMSDDDDEDDSSDTWTRQTSPFSWANANLDIVAVDVASGSTAVFVYETDRLGRLVIPDFIYKTV